MELKYPLTIVKCTLTATRHYRDKPLDWDNCEIVILRDALNLQVTKSGK